MKKLFITLCAIVFMTTALTISVYATSATLTASVDKSAVKAGDIIEINVSLKNNPGLYALFFEMPIDPEVFEFVEKDYSNSIFKSDIKSGFDLQTNSFKLNRSSDDVEDSVKIDGILCSIKLKIKDSAKNGVYFINAASDFANTIDINGNKVEVGGCDIKITVNTACPHTNKTLTPAKDSNCKEQGNNAYYTCTDCGAILKEDGKTETTIEAEKRPFGEHTYVKHDRVEPDHKNAGMDEYYTCSVCSKIFDSDKNEVANTDGFKLEPIPHTFGEEWKSDETNHWHECKCGEKTTPEAHTFDWTVVKEATEEAEGLEKGVCSVCGYETSRVIPPPIHEHTIEKVEAKPATCAAEGNIEHYTCTKCHKLFSDEAGENEIKDVSTPKDPDNHTGGTKVVGELAPTCGGYGYTGDTVCDGCGAVLTKGEPIPPTGEHEAEETKRDVKEADCSNEGYTGDTYCKDCGKKLKDGEVISKNDNHDFKWQIDVEPTFEKPGLKHEECTRCGIKQNEGTVIPPLDCFHSAMEHHEKVAATCTAAGTAEYWHCTECNRNYSDEKGTLEITDLVLPIDPNNHVNTEIRNAKPATCSSEGYTGDKYCTDCNTLIESGSAIAVNPNAHNYVNNVCTYCGNSRIVYRPVTYMYIDDYSHLASGLKERHVPDSMTKHTDGEYEWNYCLYCQHEYGKVPVVNVSVDDTVDIVVDDPVQSGDDETIPDVPVTEPEVNEPVQDTNPPTGIAIALLPIAMAAAAAIAFNKTNR